MSYFGITTGASSQVDELVEAYKQTQKYRLTPLEQKKTELETKQTFFNTINTKLNQLKSAIDKFGTYKPDENGNNIFNKLSNIEEKFITRKVISSNDEFVTATAGSSAMLGTNTVKVQQLASSDVFIGTRLNLDEQFSSDVGVGAQQFSITVGDTTKVFKISVDEDDTNESIIKKLVKSINASSEEGGFGGLVSAAFVKDTNSTGRLTLTSKNTGENNQIFFSPSVVDEEGNALPASTFAQKIGFDEALLGNERVVSTEGAAGFKISSASLLNSVIDLNGVTVTRDSNTIGDAIDGVTFTIKKTHSAQDSAVMMSTEIDTKAVETLLEPLITAFSSLSNYLVVAKERHGNDNAIRSLQGTLRSFASMSFGDNSSDSDVPKYLSELGYSINSDNVLKLTDSSKLENILKREDGAKLVSDLFTSQNGFVAKISEAISSLTSSSEDAGLVKNRLKSIDTQINANKKRIETVTKNIEAQAESTRKQYVAYLKMYYEAQNQMSLLYTMGSSGGSAYDSLISQKYNS